MSLLHLVEDTQLPREFSTTLNELPAKSLQLQKKAQDQNIHEKGTNLSEKKFKIKIFLKN